jgi:hypothetical protein
MKCNDKCPHLDGCNVGDLLASERAMQIVCAIACSGYSNHTKLEKIDKVIEMWTRDPMTLAKGGAPQWHSKTTR